MLTLAWGTALFSHNATLLINPTSCANMGQEAVTITNSSVKHNIVRDITLS